MRLTQSHDAHAGGTPARPRRLPRGVRIGLLVLAAAAGTLALAVAVLVGLVLTGPTELGFVRDRFRASVQGQLGDDYTVKVDKAVVDVDPVLGLVLEIDGTDVTDSTGATVMRVPSTRLAIDPVALLGFRLSISAVEFNAAEISLAVSKTGEVHLGDAATPWSAAPRASALAEASSSGPDGGFPQLAAALRSVDRGLDLPLNAAIAAGFHRLSFVGGTVNLWDATQGQQRRFLDTDFGVTIDPETRSLNASIATSGYAGRWSGTLDRTTNLATGEHTVSGVFSQLTLADIFPSLADRKNGPTADIPLYGRAQVDFAADGAVESANVRLDVGAGILSTGEIQGNVLLDEATLKLRWDIANRTIFVDPSPIYFGQTRGIATGWVRPAGDGRAGHFAFDLESNGAILAASDAHAPPVVADRLAVTGNVDMSARLLEIKDFAIQTATGSLALAGTVDFSGETPLLAVAASLTPMPVSTFKQMWIPFLAPGARTWVMANIVSGRIASGEFEAAVPVAKLLTDAQPPILGDALKLNLRLEDVTFRTVGDLPPITGASGNLVLAGATLGVDLDKAKVETDSGERVNVDAGAFAIDDVFDPAAVGVVEVQLSGAATALAEIADAEPLRVLAQRDLSPDDLSGTASAAVSVRLPFDKRADELADAMDWKVTVVGKQLASRKPIDGRMFSNADVTIAVNRESFTVNGKATIDGVPADVSLSQRLGEEGEAVGPGQQLARMSLDKAAMKRLGLGLDDIVDGTIGTQVSSLTDGVGQHYDLDLQAAKVTIPGLGWSKGAGVPATLSFDLVPADDGDHAENIVFQGDGFGFTGTARLNRKDGLVSADIENFALRPGDAMSFRLAATQGGYTIKARGASFDVRSVIADVAQGSGDGGAPTDLNVEADIGQATGFNGEVLEGAKIALVASNGDPVKLSVAGNLRGNPISVDLSDTPNDAHLRANAPDAGAVLSFLNIYTRVGGGTLAIDAERQGPGGPFVGQMAITNFDILNEPAVRQAVSTVPSRQTIDTARLHFERMTAHFRLTGEAIGIDEALLRGQSVGATFNGRLDLIRSQVTINGTYLPVYAVNNIFSRVPLLGLVLGGGNKEGGLIGVTFQIEGPLDAPRVYFNPLSAVAPGIFRKIFEFR